MDKQEFRNDVHESIVGSSARFADYSHSSWLLVEIERLLKSLTKEEREATLSEVEEHLRCSRAALEELGLDPSTADQEAVALFGSPSEFCNKLLRRQVKTQCAPRTLITIMVLTVLLPFALVFFMIDAFAVAYAILAIGSITFLVESWRQRHFHWKTIGKAGGVLTAVFALALGFAWVDMWSTGGMGEGPRWELKKFESTAQEQIRAIYSIQSECSPIRETFAEGEQAVDASPYYRNERYEVFSVIDLSPNGVPNYAITWSPTFAEAEQSWKNYGGYRRWMDENLTSAEDQIPAIDLASRRAFDPMTAGQGAVGGVFVTCIALLANFVVSSLRWIYDQLRRMPRRRAARG